MTYVNHIRENRLFYIFFTIGVLLRLWAVWQSYLINTDGALYIYQAKALVAGQWQKAISCKLNYISIYPVLIAISHLFFKNWIWASQAISMFFSTATIFPVYGLCRRFVDARMAAVATLLVILNPVMCSRSGDAVRGPAFWFFVSMGLLYTIRYWENRSHNSNLLIAAIAFLLATWARIEAILFLFITGAGLPLIKGKGRLKRILAFGAPVILVSLIIVSSMVVLDIPMDRILRLNRVLHSGPDMIDVYNKISYSIDHITFNYDPSYNHNPALMQRFLPETKNLIWWIAIGAILNRTMEAFFYPFVPIFLMGLWCFRKTAWQDSRWLYMLTLIISAYILLYWYMLQQWVMEYRFLMIVLIPAMPFAAVGLSWLARIMTSKWHFDRQKIVFGLAILILLMGVPRNLYPGDADKIVFRQIAAKIIEVDESDKPILISSSNHTKRILSLYTNLNHPNPPCPESDYNGEWSKYAGNLDKLVKNLRQRQIRYFLYEEKHWPANGIKPKNFNQAPSLHLLGEWYHRDTGHMRLYKIR